jgi:hypothetical protein
VLGLSLAIAVLVLKTLLMDIERSRIDVRNRRLTQRVAMLEAELAALRPHCRGDSAKDSAKDSGSDAGREGVVNENCDP